MEIRRQSGITLLELMISIGLISIVLSMTAPSFSYWIQSIRIMTVTNTLGHAIGYARSEAISRNQIVRICPTIDTKTCSKDSNWATGWITYVDISGSSSRESGDPVIKIQNGLGNIKINYNRGAKIVF